MTFKVSKEQLTKRDALAAELRQKAATLNIAIAEFNKGIEPLVHAAAEAQANYNETLEAARTLTGNVAEAAQEEFEAKSRDGKKATRGSRCEPGSSSGR